LKRGENGILYEIRSEVIKMLVTILAVIGFIAIQVLAGVFIATVLDMVKKEKTQKQRKRFKF